VSPVGWALVGVVLVIDWGWSGAWAWLALVQAPPTYRRLRQHSRTDKLVMLIENDWPFWRGFLSVTKRKIDAMSPAEFSAFRAKMIAEGQ
jgi:hypothetical protein